MTTGAELRAARRAADLTLADVARRGGVTAGHLSRVESGERQVTPATVVLYRRAIVTAFGSAPSPTVDDVKRRDLLALASVSVMARPSEPRQPDLDECAQWLAWATWRAGANALPASDVPADRTAGVAALVSRRYVVRESDGRLRFPHPGMLDFYLARDLFDAISAGSSARLAEAQTSHETDLVVAQFAGTDRKSTATLTRWMTRGATPVLRVNSAGVLAKVGTAQATDRVVGALRADAGARGLYLAAVASRVLGLEWIEAATLAAGSTTAPDDATEALASELQNPRDAAARWCAAVLIYQTGAASRGSVRAAVAEALRTEPAAENLRAMAALADGVDPINI